MSRSQRGSRIRCMTWVRIEQLRQRQGNLLATASSTVAECGAGMDAPATLSATAAPCTLRDLLRRGPQVAADRNRLSSRHGIGRTDLPADWPDQDLPRTCPP